MNIRQHEQLAEHPHTNEQMSAVTVRHYLSSLELLTLSSAFKQTGARTAELSGNKKLYRKLLET